MDALGQDFLGFCNAVYLEIFTVCRITCIIFLLLAATICLILSSSRKCESQGFSLSEVKCREPGTYCGSYFPFCQSFNQREFVKSVFFHCAGNFTHQMNTIL